MRFFSKNELLAVLLIFILVTAFTLKGLKDATRRARDFQRKQDIGIISDALHKYQEEFGFFPPSENGKIKACKGDYYSNVFEKLKELKEFDRELFFSGLKVCDWGIDPLRDLQELDSAAYLNALPSDPKSVSGLSYLYLSNTNRFQLYSYLEGEDNENGFNEKIMERELLCGNMKCSYGKSYGNTPLDISIEDYERILLEESKTGQRD